MAIYQTTTTVVPDTIASKTHVPNLPTTQDVLRRSLESNLGPLTTTFTPPSDCSTLLVRTIITTGGRYDQFYVGFGETCTTDDAGSTSVFFPESCYPGIPGALAAWHNDPNLNVPDRVKPVAYSPGLVCPAGYETACSLARHEGGSTTSSTTTDESYSDLWNILKDGETAAGCCPTGYTCKKDNYYLCTSQVTGGRKTVTAVSYDAECQPSTLRTHIPVAWMVYQDTHIAEAPRVILILPNPTATDVDAPDSEDQPLLDDGSSTGLSAGGKVAIGVVVPLVVVLLAALFWFVWRKKRAKGQKSPGGGPDAAASGGDGQFMKAELPGSGIEAITGPHGVVPDQFKLDGSQSGVVGNSGVTTGMSELGGGAVRNEASELGIARTPVSQREPAELPGT